MKKIAYCIPTYNRSEQIDIVLKNSLPFFKEYNIDIYIYDSSPEDETRSIIEKYKDNENLYYIKLPPETQGIEKIKMIYTGTNHVESYDYVWLVKDRVFFKEDIVRRILTAANNNPDAIFLRAIETTHTLTIADSYYDNPIKFYHDWAWLVTSWDVTILSKEKILNKLNWDEILKKFIINNDINFIPVIALFLVLAENEQCSIPVLDATDGKYLMNIPTPARKVEPSKFAVFNVWGYVWYQTNMNLPDVYNEEKNFVIRSVVSLPWIIGNEAKLMNYWHDGFLTDTTIASVVEIWDEISDIPWDNVCRIKNGDKAFMEECFVRFIWDSIETNRVNNIEYYYNELSWIKNDLVSKDALYALYISEIFLYEKNNNCIYLFNGGCTKELLYLKIDATINFVQAINEHSNVEGKQFKNLVLNKLISETMIGYFILKLCDNVEIAVERFNRYMCDN